MVAGGIEVLALIAVLVAYYCQPVTSQVIAVEPLEKCTSEPIMEQVLEMAPST